MEKLNNILIICIVFLSVLLFSCGTQNKNLLNNDDSFQKTINSDSLFTVKKIERKSNYYILHLEREGYFYKVISPAVGIDSNCKIGLGDKYYFSLKSIWAEPIVMESGEKILLSGKADCEDFGTTLICVEDNPKYVRNLFFANNLKGLCIINADK
ncbi:hypothetical protein O4H26_09470 [Aequorivita viscosa]|nr:hypothetical protein [Aequorivita viscosa]